MAKVFRCDKCKTYNEDNKDYQKKEKCVVTLTLLEQTRRDDEEVRHFELCKKCTDLLNIFLTQKPE